ncbi:hypothetical protein FB390_5949 [Nocardia bhagyanarayanae]|uniref:Uncharacterized protein n=1 Tax=Nocardia bhagyanarayanae TaxID=1215925 RepID=A0A543EW55_9NOCA|nr:hypothetical protein FB390_5949 [Nocardia bhagyanarayanae]
MIVGRAELLELIDTLVRVPRGKTEEAGNPVLVLEGYGGSGRTTVLEQVLDRWQRRTPTVLVRPLERPYDPDNPARPVLAAAMLGLSMDLPGFPMAFPRTVVAQIAISENFTEIPATEHRERLRTALNQYKDRAALVGFIGDLVGLVGAQAANIKLPGASVIAPTLSQHLSNLVVGRLTRGRLITKITWGSAVSWYGHQDLGLRADAETVLIELGIKAASEDAATRRGVDDLLISAFLADLRHSAARVAGRPSNVVVLLDDGDTPTAIAFTSALLRAREAMTAAGSSLTDPLTLVTTSSGVLAEELDGQVPAPVTWTPRRRADPSERDAWARLRIDDFTEFEVKTLAKDVTSIEADRIGEHVYRLTDGHPAATAYVLDRMRQRRRSVDGLDDLLRDNHAGPGTAVQRHLLGMFAKDLHPRKQLDDDILDALVTVSAARTKGDALRLLTLLPSGIGERSPLFRSPSLWSGPPDSEVLPAFVRRMGLRELAARTNHRAGWDRVFGKLLDTVPSGDRPGRLHYTRLLRGGAAIVDELGELLPITAATEWLSLFDEIVEMSDPRRPDADLVDGSDHATSRVEHIAVLLAVVPAVESDLRITIAGRREILCARAAHSFERLAVDATDRSPFLLRANDYHDRARRSR